MTNSTALKNDDTHVIERAGTSDELIKRAEELAPALKERATEVLSGRAEAFGIR